MAKLGSFLFILFFARIGFASLEQEAKNYVNSVLKNQTLPIREEGLQPDFAKNLSGVATFSPIEKAKLDKLQNQFEQKDLENSEENNNMQQCLRMELGKDVSQTSSAAKVLIAQKKQNQNELIPNQKPKVELIEPMMTDILPKKFPEFESYEAAEFGNAATHLIVVKEMGAPMQDNLSGMGGNHDNPRAFYGLCRRCTVTLGRAFKDCCHLKGIAQGLLGECRAEEKELAKAEVKEKRCHKVQEKYCSKKKLGICVEKKEAYCCYGSQMAKVIQEIAHQQLNLPWGDGENPRCESLTAEELSRIDFDTPYASAQLGQLIADYQGTAQQKYQLVQNQVSSLQSTDAKVNALQERLNKHFNGHHK